MSRVEKLILGIGVCGVSLGIGMMAVGIAMKKRGGR